MRIPKPKREAKVKKPLRRRAPSKVRKKLGLLADKLFSLIVRQQGRCRWHIFSGGVSCSGPIQCAHIVSRRYRSVRWDEDNAMPLCAGAHVWTTHNPLEWEEFVTEYMGAVRFGDLKARARQKWNGDIEGTVARLKERAAVLGIKA